MEYYEGYLLGAYWFMRALFVGSILFCMTAKFLGFIIKDINKSLILTTILFYNCSHKNKIIFHFQIPYWPQSGHHELAAINFIGIGYIIGHTYINNFIQNNKRNVFLPSLSLLACCIYFHPGTMEGGSNCYDWLSIAISGIDGFMIMHIYAQTLNNSNILKPIIKGLIFIGNNTFYILTFNFLMLKPISYAKTLVSR